MSTPLAKMEKSQVEFLLKGSNDPAIAKEFGITRQAVFHIRKKFGIPSSKSRAPENKKRIIEFRKNGMSVAKISSSVGMSQSYIYKVLSEAANGQKRGNSTG